MKKITLFSYHFKKVISIPVILEQTFHNVTYRPAVSLYVATICYIKDDLLLGVNNLTSKREKNMF